jgi:UDP-glucose 4-epimerase
MTQVLVTGGAGYIGSLCARALCRSGYRVRILDDLSTGHAWAAERTGAELMVASMLDPDAVRAALRGVEAVLHFAGHSQVGESVRRPGFYRDQNVGGAEVLAEAMTSLGIDKVVFSSSAAVYGEPDTVPIPETARTLPINPYGQTKLDAESRLNAAGLDVAALRYFNAAGAASDLQLGEAHDPETHLIPRLLEQAEAGRPFTVFGNDYPTPDGTCVRDYIHVEDLATAHADALKALLDGWSGDAVNLGSGGGHSVLEVLEAVRAVAGDSPITIEPRRAGDPPSLVADTTRARDVLGWTPKYSLVDMVTDAWRWHRSGGRSPGNDEQL